MFRLNTNKSILINRGDDSDKFTLNLNYGGDDGNQIPLIIVPEIQITSKLYCTLDEKIWKKKIFEQGVYSFMYLKDKWYLLNEEVILADYGITCLSTPSNYDTIVITFNTEKCEIYLYICELHTSIRDFLVKKTFRKNGDVVTEFSNKPPHMLINDNPITSDGNMSLFLEGNDTDDLEAGEYYYVIQAMFFDKTLNRYKTTTVTNRYPFYVIDDCFDRRWQ